MNVQSRFVNGQIAHNTNLSKDLQLVIIFPGNGQKIIDTI